MLTQIVKTYVSVVKTVYNFPHNLEHDCFLIFIEHYRGNNTSVFGVIGLPG